MNTKTNNHRKLLLSRVYGIRRFIGTYFLVGFSARLHPNGFPFWEVVVSDLTDTLTVYCLDESCILGDLQPQSLVHIEASLDQSASAAFYRCKGISPTSANRVTLSSITQLPRALCAVPDALEQLKALIDSIKHQALSAFVTDVILSQTTAIPYITCPASLKHHHNFKSGLLVHSVEVANRISKDSTLTDEQRDVGVVSALLHDIGKTQTMTADLKRTAIGDLIDHDDLTLELCGPALSKLERVHSNLANQLRHAWTCESPGSRYGYKAKTLVAKRLRFFDNQSANLTKEIN